MKDGVRLEFINSTTAGNHVREQAQQLLQQNWDEIGAKMTISNFPPAVMWGDNWMQSKFDTAMVGIGFMIGPDADTTDYFSSNRSPPRAARARTRRNTPIPRSTSCSAEGADTVDQDKRKAAYYKMQEQSRARTCLICRSSSTRWFEGTKLSRASRRTYKSSENCYNANTWYWA